MCAGDLGAYWLTSGFAGCYWFVVGSPGLWWVALVGTGFYWSVVFIAPYTGLYWSRGGPKEGVVVGGDVHTGRGGVLLVLTGLGWVALACGGL